MAVYLLRRFLYMASLVMMGVILWVYAYTAQVNAQIRHNSMVPAGSHIVVADSDDSQ
jgi:hypothetical protein